jgi:Arc/MetJ-type ribon-helix-helix transcriptional regulator
MGAIEISREDEAQINRLMKEMKVNSKASVVRAALHILREQLDREKLHAEIRESVRMCVHADRKENLSLSGPGIARNG